MADDNMANGVESEGDARAVEIDGVPKKDHGDADFDRSRMSLKIEQLEDEKAGLERENGANRETIGSLTAEVQELRNDKKEMKDRLGEMDKMLEQAESDKKTTETIAARAYELETQVSRMQHDMISLQSEAEEANAEVSKLKSLLEEKTEELKGLQKDKASSCDEVDKANAQLRKETSEKAKLEEEMRLKIGEKEKEVNELKKRTEELESALAKNALELEKMIKAKKAEAGAKTDAVEVQKRDAEKVEVLESKLSSLKEELEESKRVISELREKAVSGVNGVASIARNEIFGSEEKGVESLKVQWPAVAVATGTVLAVTAVVYLKFAKRMENH